MSRYADRKFPARLQMPSSAWSVVRHRLGAKDAIIEAFTDGDSTYDADEVGHACDEIERKFGQSPREAEVTRLEAEVLEDCLDGSTYFADWDEAVAAGEVDPAKVRREMRAAEELAKRLSAILGRAVVLSER